MNSEQVCFRILRAESESAVEEIVASLTELSNADNWHPIDGRETNYNIVTNQASTGGKALTELCTNMVDAILMKSAHQKGVSLTGPDAPQSVIRGVRDLVGLRGARSGILSEVDDPKYLQEFAEENLVIGVTGGRRGEDVCFTFVDNGEGQHARDFEDTFLSLSKGNKSNIPFVQGKYNMGSSGVLTYCGRHWYKLIISRRWDESGDWGWTLVRRRPGDGMPVAEYFKLDGAVPTFPPAILRPMNLSGGDTDPKVRLDTGTVVKLYNYQMETSPNFRNVRESLNENLVSTVLPFRLMHYGNRPDPRRGGRRALGVDERTVNGMSFLLLRKDADDEEGDGYEPGNERHIGDIDHPDLGSVSVRAIVLERELPGWLKPNRNTSRVFHSVNGQVQFKQNRAYVSQRCKLPGLKDRVVLIVDASNLSEAAHNDVWKGDRETIRATSIGQLYINEVTNLIARSDFLKELQNRIAREEVESLTQETQTTMFQSLVDSDPSIGQLLPGGLLVKLPGYVGRGGKDGGYEWRGKYSPTFLELTARSIKTNGADIVADGRRVVSFKTDVCNEYLTRPDNTGRMFVTGGVGDKFSYTRSLRDGRLTVTFEALPGRVATGDEFAFSVGLLDDAIPEPVTEDLKLRVVESRPIRKGGGGGRRTRIGEGDEDAGEGRGLPRTKWLTQDGRSIGEEETEVWPDDFTDQDGGEIRDLGEDDKLYFINYDNAHFRRFLDSERGDLGKRVVAEQYRVGCWFR